MARNGPRLAGIFDVVPDRGEHVGGQDDERAEQEQPELGPPLGLGTTDPHSLGGRETTEESGTGSSLLPGLVSDPGTWDPRGAVTGGTLEV